MGSSSSIATQFVGAIQGTRRTSTKHDDIELSSFLEDDELEEESSAQHGLLKSRATSRWRRPRRDQAKSTYTGSWAPRYVLRTVLMLLGCYQVILFALSILLALCPDTALYGIASFAIDGDLSGDTLSIAGATSTVSCHSHNDYWRRRPLHAAIELGCTSVEADVWLEGEDLLVGHSRSSLTTERTLEKMYLDPIKDILDRRTRNRDVDGKEGIFEYDPAQSLILLIDFKTDGEVLWPVLMHQLEPLRQSGYLTTFNGTDIVQGAVTIVASGDVFFRDVIRNPHHRDIFFDAPLELMGSDTPDTIELNIELGETTEAIEERAMSQKRPTNPAVYSVANSFYASVSFKKSIGYPWGSRLSRSQLDLMRTQIRAAHSKGLKVRYWGVPTWPVGVRNYLWRVLVREGVDYLSIDDVRAAVRGDWGPRKGGWYRKWWT